MDKAAAFSRIFLGVVLVVIIYACYLVFSPFLTNIVIAFTLSVLFYRWCGSLAKKFGGRRKLAAALICFLILAALIIPFSYLTVYVAQQAVDSSRNVLDFLGRNSIDMFISKINSPGLVSLDAGEIKEFVAKLVQVVEEWLMSLANIIIGKTINFILSVIIVLITTFFFLVDGKEMLERIREFIPMSNQHLEKIFETFKEISYSTLLSVLVVAIVQSVVMAIGLWIVGVPVFFPTIFTAIASLVPGGPLLVWLPISAYLLLTGHLWQGIFMIAWGGVVLPIVENIAKAAVLQGKVKVHVIFILFSVLGGIKLFGFWGVVYGPLILSLAITLLDIYKLEFKTTLDEIKKEG